jgi:hypothetical protein
MTETAWITGATSGIGAAFAEYYASRGFDLVLTGRREDKLRNVAEGLKKKYSVKYSLYLGELTDESIVSQIETDLRKDNNASVLINNAGFAYYGAFHERDLTIHRTMLSVHCDVMVRLTHAALQTMLASKRGTIINVASVAGFFPYPGHTMYSATKTFMINFSESLAVRYQDDGIKIIALCPGMTITDFHTRMGYKAEKVYKKSGFEKAHTPQDVVKETIRCLKRGKFVCIPGFNNRFLIWLSRQVPRKLLYKVMKNWISNRRDNPAFKQKSG